MLVTPSSVSHNLVWPMLLMTASQASRNSLAFPGIPSNPFICEEAIWVAAAEVKPAMTGKEKNSTTKPTRNPLFWNAPPTIFLMFCQGKLSILNAGKFGETITKVKVEGLILKTVKFQAVLLLKFCWFINYEVFLRRLSTWSYFSFFFFSLVQKSSKNLINKH